MCVRYKYMLLLVITNFKDKCRKLNNRFKIFYINNCMYADSSYTPTTNYLNRDTPTTNINCDQITLKKKLNIDIERYYLYNISKHNHLVLQTKLNNDIIDYKYNII